MSLRVYNRKRKFDKTPEPRGKKKAHKGDLRFVVQMHDASRLHWDFRLEFDGVYKSWAVPKGPSLNPLDQRLAVFVEDHPLDYGTFEGIIPSGNYGAGTVMLWDSGTYQERGSEDRKKSEAAMKKNFEKGHLTFVLDGEKLKGEFALIKLKKDKSQKAWLLVKKRDQHSTYKRSEIPANTSVKTGRTMEQIERQAEKKGDVWLPEKGRQPFEKSSAEKEAEAKPKIAKPTVKSKAKKSTIPRKVKPMIPTLSRKPIESGWIVDPHLDGLRAIAEVEGKRANLYSKAGLSFAKKHPKIVEELESLGVTAVFDGEIVDSKYFVYDLLYWEDRDLRDEPLKVRKELLAKAIRDQKHVKQASDKMKSDKSVIKDPESVYKSGTTSNWRIVESADGGKTKKKSKSAAKEISEEPRLSNLSKVYFPEDKITKGDLINYYDSIAEYILPYLKDRPESMNRHPNGIDKPGFYQKDVTGHIPKWLKTFRVYSESSDKSIDYLLCQDKRSLLYMANLGCIELNPWFSRVQHLDNPDFLVIDLDPDDNDFNHVIEIAHEVHEILDNVGAPNFVKTSGSTGIHIGVPMGAKYDFDTGRDFAEAVCRIVAKKFPATTSVERNPNRRRKKIYLDYMQNRRSQTLAAPLCVRPKPGAPVSMPLTWDELKKGLKPEQFNIRNALSRVKKFDDPWRHVFGRAADLKKCSAALGRKYRKD